MVRTVCCIVCSVVPFLGLVLCGRNWSVRKGMIAKVISSEVRTASIIVSGSLCANPLVFLGRPSNGRKVKIRAVA